MKDYTRSVITIACGNKTYINYAANLAASFLLWNKNENIIFYLVTDSPQNIPKELKTHREIIIVKSSNLGEGFSSKLDMYSYIKTDQTLFIDADCLVYGNLNPIFDKFEKVQFSTIGHNIYEGSNIGFCKNVEDVMVNTEIEYFPLLCGSLYFFKKGEIAENIFLTAKKLLQNYNEIGLLKLRGVENEEPLLAISMAKNKQELLKDDGEIKADRMFYEHLTSNVVKGKAKLWYTSEPPVPEYSKNKTAKPVIIHFNASFTETHEYNAEITRLNLVFYMHINVELASIYANFRYVYPGLIIINLKRILRPFYRALFGIRKVSKSKRI